MKTFRTLAILLTLGASYFAFVKPAAQAQPPAAVTSYTVPTVAPTYPVTPEARRAAKLEQQRIDTANAQAIAQIRANARAAQYEAGQHRLRAYKLRLAQQRAAQGR